MAAMRLENCLGKKQQLLRDVSSPSSVVSTGLPTLTP